KVNATLPVSLVMVRAIRDYRERTGFRVGFKPAGGISTARHAADWLALMKEELGDAWMRPNLFRLGASASSRTSSASSSTTPPAATRPSSAIPWPEEGATARASRRSR